MDADERARYAELFSIVSHDIRGPLGVILVAVGELLDARVGPITDEQRALVQLVRRSSERLSRLAANVSLLEKTNGADLAISPQPIDLRDVARRSVESFERSGEIGKKLRVTLRLPDERVSVSGDAELLVHACTNVVANAIRSGRAEITVTVANDAGAAVLAVDDDGPGIPGNLLPTLLEPARVRGAEGRDTRGLGLPIVRGILQAHRAVLSAENRFDEAGRPQGARVRFAFGPHL